MSGRTIRLEPVTFRTLSPGRFGLQGGISGDAGEWRSGSGPPTTRSHSAATCHAAPARSWPARPASSWVLHDSLWSGNESRRSSASQSAFAGSPVRSAISASRPDRIGHELLVAQVDQLVRPGWRARPVRWRLHLLHPVPGGQLPGVTAGRLPLVGRRAVPEHPEPRPPVHLAQRRTRRPDRRGSAARTSRSGKASTSSGRRRLLAIRLQSTTLTAAVSTQPGEGGAQLGRRRPRAGGRGGTGASGMPQRVNSDSPSVGMGSSLWASGRRPL